MKETRYFYSQQAEQGCLPPEEAAHATKVLRLSQGDKIIVTDGKGYLYDCTVTLAKGNICQYDIISKKTTEKPWNRFVHMAVAPTKNIDRTEWFVEKAVEIGVDAITFLDCKFSLRKTVKMQRMEKIVISAAKQSHKTFIPTLQDVVSFRQFVTASGDTHKFIAHCYDDPELLDPKGAKPFLLDVVPQDETPVTILIGPEGDFSADEVKLAMQNGYIPISLSPSRLRTETAALVALHLAQISSTNR